MRQHRDNVGVLAVISENSLKSLCKRYDVPYTFFENLPLGRKKNHGLKEALKQDWDYLMEMNSDDLVKNDLLDVYDKVKYDYVGLKNFCFIDSKTLECRQVVSNTIFGIARRYSRRLIERVGRMWNDEASVGMDNYANWRIWTETKTEGKQLFTKQPLAADVKSDVNIWKFNKELGVKYKIEDFLKGISEDEISMLYGIKNKYSPGN